MRNVFRFLLVVLVFVNVPVLAQQRSAKRGICWDEKNQQFTGAPIAKMAPGVAWVYNWGVAPTGSSTVFTPTTMTFIPMCWNGDFNDTSLRQYLTAHQGEVKYLLAFNEPNLQYSAGGSAMTPQQAANAWPKVEQVAADFGLQIVAPALNFTGDYVGGKIWEPFAWYDEFFRLVPNAKVDYLCFHSYMNYYSAVDWLVNEYFYTDKEENDLMTTANRAKYPNLVAFMDNYKTAHGHYPKMFLTEFCSWETNSYPYAAGITLDFQIDQMVQKLLKLELSDMVEGYAWFMANPTGGAASFPYMSIFKTNTSSSDLSDLGKVYVYMSSFDKEKYYMTGESILAKDFIFGSRHYLSGPCLIICTTLINKCLLCRPLPVIHEIKRLSGKRRIGNRECIVGKRPCEGIVTNCVCFQGAVISSCSYFCGSIFPCESNTVRCPRAVYLHSELIITDCGNRYGP
jgi:hypothetical protein